MTVGGDDPRPRRADDFVVTFRDNAAVGVQTEVLNVDVCLWLEDNLTRRRFYALRYEDSVVEEILKHRVFCFGDFSYLYHSYTITSSKC